MSTPRKVKEDMEEKRTKLGALREQLGLTTRQMAGMLEVKRNAYTQWEYGYAKPSVMNAFILEEFFGEPLLDLLSSAVVVRKGEHQRDITIVQL